MNKNANNRRLARDRRFGERRIQCLLNLTSERRSGRERRCGFDRRTILHIHCLNCGRPLFGRLREAGEYELIFANLECLQSRVRPQVYQCPHCQSRHEEAERFIGFSKEVTFRLVTAHSPSPLS